MSLKLISWPDKMRPGHMGWFMRDGSHECHLPIEVQLVKYLLDREALK